MPVPSGPFQAVSTDILGPLRKTTTGNKYVLVFICYMTKFVELIPLKDMCAVTVADAFIKNVFCRHGICKVLHSDRGTNYLSNHRRLCRVKNMLAMYLKYHFIYFRYIASICLTLHRRLWSNLVKEICRLLDIRKTQITSFHPQCNGQSERMMSTIVNSISKRIDDDEDNLDRFIPFIQFSYNTPCLDSTEYTPLFLLHGRHPGSFVT